VSSIVYLPGVSCRAFSAWVSAHSLRGSPLCALTLTKKVRAPLNTLSLMHSMIEVMMSTFASPASVVRGPLPIQPTCRENSWQSGMSWNFKAYLSRCDDSGFIKRHSPTPREWATARRRRTSSRGRTAGNRAARAGFMKSQTSDLLARGSTGCGRP
jgi:hypothetical protein